MKFRLQLVTVNDSGQEQVLDIAQLERNGVTMETLGLSLAEGKLLLKQVQEALLGLRCCPDCGQARQGRGHHEVTARTVFGNVGLQSPRLEHCRCQPHAEKTFSPLQTLLPGHTSPEL